MQEKPLLILNTCPDTETARAIANALVGQSLAACVNIIPAIQSIYRWQDKIECDNEVLLLIKSPQECYPALEAVILSLHPYELPEIIVVPIDSGLPGYLNWINDCSPRCDD